MKKPLNTSLAALLTLSTLALTGCDVEDFSSTLKATHSFSAVATTNGQNQAVIVPAGTYSDLTITENSGFLGLGNNVSFAMTVGGKDENFVFQVPSNATLPDPVKGGPFSLASSASGQPFDITAKLAAQVVTDGDEYTQQDSCTYDCFCNQECTGGYDSDGTCEGWTNQCQSCNGTEYDTGYDEETTQNVSGSFTAPGKPSQVYATFTGKSDTTQFVVTSSSECN